MGEQEQKYLTDEQYNEFMEELKDCVFKASDFIQSMEKYEISIDTYSEQGAIPTKEQQAKGKETAEELIALFEKISKMLA